MTRHRPHREARSAAVIVRRPSRRAWAVVVLLTLCACQRAAPLSVRVVDISASDVTGEPAAAPPLAAELLREACRAGLQRAGVKVALQEGKRARGDFRLRLELALHYVAQGSEGAARNLMRAAARGRLQAEPPAAPGEAPLEITRFNQDALAEQALPDKLDAAALAAAWRAHGLRSATDTAAALGAQLKLLEQPSPALLQQLNRPDLDSEVRLVAIQLLGLRKDRKAVPALIKLLSHQEADVRDRAMGALIEIGDRSAVKALAASAQFSDLYELGKILEAVAQLGGEEARSYLSFVAGGHQSEQIRQEARRALTHLEQREQREQKKEP